MKHIFISYRRLDSEYVVGRIYDELSRRYGEKYIFKDTESIPLGVDFRKELSKVLKSCHIVIIIIGKEWYKENKITGKNRLFDLEDYVRIEIEEAINRKIPIIPVTISSAKLPKKNDLPDSIEQLAYRNSLEIRPDPDFKKDIEKLISSVNIIYKRVGSFRKTIYGAIIFLLILFFSYQAYILYRNAGCEVEVSKLEDRVDILTGYYETNENEIKYPFYQEEIKSNSSKIITKLKEIQDHCLDSNYLEKKYELLSIIYFLKSAVISRPEINNINSKKDSLKQIEKSLNSVDKLIELRKENNRNPVYSNFLNHLLANLYAVKEFLGEKEESINVDRYIKDIDSIYLERKNLYNDFFINKHEEVKNGWSNRK